jgi:hypothetical protein
MQQIKLRSALERQAPCGYVPGVLGASKLISIDLMVCTKRWFVNLIVHTPSIVEVLTGTAQSSGRRGGAVLNELHWRNSRQFANHRSSTLRGSTKRPPATNFKIACLNPSIRRLISTTCPHRDATIGCPHLLAPSSNKRVRETAAYQENIRRTSRAWASSIHSIR